MDKKVNNKLDSKLRKEQEKKRREQNTDPPSGASLQGVDILKQRYGSILH